MALGLLAAATGEPVIPGRQPRRDNRDAPRRSQGPPFSDDSSSGSWPVPERRHFGTASILWATLGALTPLTLFRIIASLRRKSREG
jgi:hypothetical protein